MLCCDSHPEASLTKEFVNPIVRFLVASIGLVAYVLARTITRATDFPAPILWILVVGAVGSVIMTFMYMTRQKKYEFVQVLRFTLIVSVLAFGVVFGITWLLSR